MLKAKENNLNDLVVQDRKSVADPGFARGGGANSPGGANIRFCQNFPNIA